MSVTTMLTFEWEDTQRRANLAMKDGMKDLFTAHGWWAHVAGLFVLSARQTGKTTALNALITHIKKYHRSDDRVIAVAPCGSQLDLIEGADMYVQSNNEMVNKLRGIGESMYHLVVDEFMFLDESKRDYLLSKRWKSVTMIGSMK
jgi:hypothetical protein